MLKGLQRISCEERVGELSLFAMRKRKLGGDLPFSLKRRCKEDGTRLFSAVFSDRTRSDGHKIKHGECHLNTRKTFAP